MSAQYVVPDGWMDIASEAAQKAWVGGANAVEMRHAALAALAAVLPLAVAQERERCARVADARHDANKADAQTASMTRPVNAPLLFNHQARYDEAAKIAAAIRQEPGHV